MIMTAQYRPYRGTASHSLDRSLVNHFLIVVLMQTRTVSTVQRRSISAGPTTSQAYRSTRRPLKTFPSPVGSVHSSSPFSSPSSSVRSAFSLASSVTVLTRNASPKLFVFTLTCCCSPILRNNCRLLPWIPSARRI